jgi:hypothetical protein
MKNLDNSAENAVFPGCCTCRRSSPQWSPDPALSTTPRWARVSLTPPKCLTVRSPSSGVSLASTNTSETWVCDERGKPFGRASRRGRETRAERSPRDPHGDAYSHIRGSDRRMPARGHEPAPPLSTASLTVWHRVVPLPGLSNLAPRPRRLSRSRRECRSLGSGR